MITRPPLDDNIPGVASLTTVKVELLYWFMMIDVCYCKKRKKTGREKL